ncbi:MAG: response regulator [Spirochaetes bacterium]|nr:response regulator [Spirochaetota bacterium]
MKKILLLEDEIIIGHDISDILHQNNYDVSHCFSFDEAVKNITSATIDLAIIDIFLKEKKTGIDFANYIKSNFNIPFIFLTGNSDPSTVNLAKETNPHGFITKPVNPIALYSTIEIVFSKFELQQQLSQSRFLLKNLINSIPESLFLLGEEGEILESNIEGANRVNISVDNIIGRNFYEIYSKSVITEKKLINKAGQNNSPISFEEENNRKYYNYQIYPIKNRNGNDYISVFIRDVTKQNLAEAERNQALLELDKIMNILPVSICIINENKDIIRYNKTFSDFFLSRSDCDNSKCFNILPNKMCSDNNCPLMNLQAGNHEFQISYNTGNEEKKFLVRANDFSYGNSSSETYILLSLTDITEYTKLIHIASNAIENERKEIGQQLHDGVGQKLTGLSFILSTIKKTINENAPEKNEIMNIFADNLHESIEMIRNISKGLWPINIKKHGFSNSIYELVENLSTVYATKIDLFFKTPVEFNDTFIANNLYFILQEALLNAIKHGTGDAVRLTITDNSSKICITVENNFLKKTAYKTTPGIGNFIMQYRANLINANIIKNITENRYNTQINLDYSGHE